MKKYNSFGMSNCIWVTFCILLPFLSLAQRTVPDSTKNEIQSFNHSEDSVSLPESLRKFNVDTLVIKTVEVESNSNTETSNLTILYIAFGGILTWISQYFLKKQERSINRHNLREEKRIVHIEKVVEMINNLCLCDPNDSNSILAQVNSLNQYIFSNSIYIGKEYEVITEEVSDYFNTVANNPATKDIITELNFIKAIKKAFNR